ncbi:MTH1187 family thiamine-binding protein [Thiohalomonas denitrificans]|uniref:MTH1187 family thiamine-binding protein n=1 Tax=Thiohalomonas denitrificans TaxID=415747 RepID=UPI0026E91E3A|nr:MTH1187 family thiamine-binding protein [Thiohalomonas denitrificans]
MKALVNLQVIPIGTGVSVSAYIAACGAILEEAGLETELHANGTNIEGEWDRVFEAIKRCHERVHEMGAPRIQTLVSVGTRTDKEQSLKDKVESVRRRTRE